ADLTVVLGDDCETQQTNREEERDDRRAAPAPLPRDLRPAPRDCGRHCLCLQRLAALVDQGGGEAMPPRTEGVDAGETEQCRGAIPGNPPPVGRRPCGAVARRKDLS